MTQPKKSIDTKKGVDTSTLVAVGGGVALLGLGLYLTYSGFGKVQGKNATITFNHKGGSETIRVGVGFAPSLAHGYDVISLFKYQVITVEDDPEAKGYVVKIKGDEEVPKVSELSPGTYDAWVFIAKAEGELHGDPWWWWPIIPEPYITAYWQGDVLKIKE